MPLLGVDLPAVTPALGPAQVAVLQAMALGDRIDVDYQCNLVDLAGNVLDDISAHVVKDPNAPSSITHTSTATVPGVLTITLDTPLVWGQDLIAPSMVLQSYEYAGGAPQVFPLGVYVATSPSRSLKKSAAYTVTGYEKVYLLQSDVGDSMSFASASTYAAGVKAVLVAAGVMPSGGALADYMNYPGDWAAKTLPNDLTFPLDDSNQSKYVDIVNALLAASGCLPVFTDQLGRFVAQYLAPTPDIAPSRWLFAGGLTAYAPATFPHDAMLDFAGGTYDADVWNVPNQWVFVQQGLTFQPTGTDGTSGRYVVDNLAHPPSDQITTGRIVRSVQFLNASGSADLIAQGDAIVAAQYAQAEAIKLTSAAWPAAWHYDVFQYTDPELPRTTLRKVRAQDWTLPLDGSPMTWDTLVVAQA